MRLLHTKVHLETHLARSEDALCYGIFMKVSCREASWCLLDLRWQLLDTNSHPQRAEKCILATRVRLLATRVRLLAVRVRLLATRLHLLATRVHLLATSLCLLATKVELFDFCL